MSTAVLITRTVGICLCDGMQEDSDILVCLRVITCICNKQQPTLDIGLTAVEICVSTNSSVASKIKRQPLYTLGLLHMQLQ